MKKLIIVLLLSPLIFSCITTGNVLDKVADTAFEKTVEKAAIAAVEDAPEEVVEPAIIEDPPEPIQPPEPVKFVPTEEQIVEAVKAYDLESLTELLSDVDDVKTIVGDEVLLCHLAEEAMGMTAQKNELLALLVEKKAYLLQLDKDGKSFTRYAHAMEMGGTERTSYMDEILGDKFKIRINALRSDNLEEIIALTDVMPVDSSLLKSAVQEKAAKITSWVLAQGISADLIDPITGENLLHIACDDKPYDFTFDNRIELVSTLLDAGVDVNLENKKGDTPIERMFISQGGKQGSAILLAEVLLEAGADVNAVTSQNRSLLHHAADRRDDDLIKFFLDEGAVIDEGTLTHMNLSPATMERLMEKGADPLNFADNIQGLLDPETQHNFAVLLMEKGVAASDFDLRFVRDNFKTLTYLVERGADVGASDVLMNCISDYKGMERIEYLVQHGADLARKYYDDYTALHFAVKYKKNDVVIYLIDQGAELNPVDSKGKTPLDYCKSNNKDLMKLLIDAGAKSASEL